MPKYGCRKRLRVSKSVLDSNGRIKEEKRSDTRLPKFEHELRNALLAACKSDVSLVKFISDNDYLMRTDIRKLLMFDYDKQWKQAKRLMKKHNLPFRPKVPSARSFRKILTPNSVDIDRPIRREIPPYDCTDDWIHKITKEYDLIDINETFGGKARQIWPDIFKIARRSDGVKYEAKPHPCCRHGWLYKHYVVGKKSAKAIGRMAGVPHMTVDKWLVKHGIRKN